MRKETSVAIVIGIVFGLVVAFGVWRANSALEKRTAATIESEEEESPIPTSEPQSTADNGLVLLPKPNYVSSKNEITLTGNATSGSTLVVSTSDYDEIFPAMGGNFNHQIKLSPGVNQIVVYSFDKSGNATNEKRVVVYSPDVVFDEKKSDDTPEDRVGKRLDQVADYPISYMGTITDKTDNSLQIKDTNGTIQLVATDAETTYSQETTTKRKISFADVAIGDFVISIGTETTKGVLNAKKVIITNPIKDPASKVIFGNIESIKGKTIVLTDTAKIQWTLSFPSKWTGPDIKEMSVGAGLIAIGIPDSESPEKVSIRTVGLVTTDIPN